MEWNLYNKPTKLTVELGRIVQQGVNIWDFEYPSYYTGEDKKAFEQKVIDHYYFRQIGQETVGRWLHYFRTRMREIMPYYIQLYESCALMASLDDPFGNVDITETFEQETSDTGKTTDSTDTETTGKNTRNANGENGNIRKFSNTPQGSISNLDSYMTEATQESGTTSETVTDNSEGSAKVTGNGTHENSGTVKHTLTRKGNQGVNTYAHDMKELRETFLNVDMQIINELNDLFLGVY